MTDRRIQIIAFALCVAVLSPVQSDDNSPTELRTRKPILKSLYRHEHRYKEFVTQDSKALVCIFVSTDCPIAQLYMPLLKTMYYDFNGIDPKKVSYEPYKEAVPFLAIYANAGDNVQSMAIHAQNLDYPFRALLDVDGRFAQQLGVQRTPEVVVFDSKFKIRYRGAIDDQYSKGGVKPKARKHYLEDALTSVLAGRPVVPDETTAAGCLIQRRAGDDAPKTVTYFKDVLPILQQRCQTCHRPGEVGPFPLLSYDDATDHADMILEVVQERRMPPWPAISKHAFVKDARLNETQIATIRRWVENGLHKGETDDAPRPIQWPKKRDWRIGEPNLTLEMDRTFQVPATGLIDYQYYRFKLDFAKDRWIRGVEVQAGNPRVVHHILVHQVPTGGGVGGFNMLQLYGGLGASRTDTMVGDYSPGDDNSARRYGTDSGLRIHAGNDVVFELHYTPIGKAQSDRSRMGLILGDTKPKTEVKSRLFLKPRGKFLIPKRHPHFREQDTYWFERNVRIIGVRPHMHLRAKHYQLDIVHPDDGERKETILQIPIWDYFWHKTYMFKEPLVLPAGKELLATVIYDNSDFNPNNPNPDDEVPWGQGTEHEMFNTFILYEELNK